MKRDSRGYRHEFGSLREFIDAHKEAKFTDSSGKDISKEVIDLALQLIAVHHGRGRPHFPKGGFDPDCESRSDEIHTESIDDSPGKKTHPTHTSLSAVNKPRLH